VKGQQNTQKMCVCVSVELAFQIIGNIYPLSLWTIFRMGVIDAPWKRGCQIH